MKKANKAAIVLIAVILLTACGKRADSTVTMEEIVVPEISSEDLLVDSLEYLLQDDEEASIQEQEVSADDGEESETSESVSLILYYRNGSCDGLDSRTEEAEELTADALIAALARHNIVSLDTKVLSFTEEDSEEGKVLYLDLSAGMKRYLGTMTREAKDIIIDSIANTFLVNYDADTIYIQIEGKPLHQSVKVDEV